MSPKARAVLTAAVVFAVAMGALQYGGWWWAWLTGIVFLAARGRFRLPLLGGGLPWADRLIIRENRKAYRHTRLVLRQRRREERARRSRRRQQ